MSTRIKICGLSTADAIAAAVDGGTSYLGFVFFPKSPRNVGISTARDLAIDVPPGVAKVALTVNADDDTLQAITDSVPLDMLQLHGSESPDRVREVREKFGLPVMKAVGVADAGDVENLDRYSKVADQLLVDAKPPKKSKLPGGNGVAFDWRLISTRRWTVPWMLAGGLDPKNIAEAIALTGAKQVDVSSGVESAPGIKDTSKIDAFCRAVRQSG